MYYYTLLPPRKLITLDLLPACSTSWTFKWFLEPLSAYRFSEGIVLILAENLACATGSTGRCFILVFAGSFPRKLSPFQFLEGLTGLGTNPPPQFGQTF